MTPLEERLKAALDARAQTFDADPNAWTRVRRRIAPRARWKRWAPAALPVALIAALAPFLLGGGQPGNPATDPQAVYDRLMKDKTPTGEVLKVEEAPLRLWTAKGAQGRPELCFLTWHDGGNPYGACDSAVITGAMAVRGVGAIQTGNEAEILDFGLARTTAVRGEATTKDGRTLPVKLHRGQGRPGPIWTLRHRSRDQVTAVRFFDADGGQAGFIYTKSGFAATQQPTGAELSAAEGVSIRPYRVAGAPLPEGDSLQWTRGGRVIGMLPSDPKLQFGNQPVQIFVDDGLVAGAVRKDIAKVEVVIDGRTVVLTASPDPWKWGVGLLAPVLTGLDDTAVITETAAFDAKGTELWRKRHPGLPNMEPTEPIGRAVTVPGTEDFSFGPVRLWMAKSPTAEPGDKLRLCSSGGVTDEGRELQQCISLINPMSPDEVESTAVSYLPGPGAIVEFGLSRDYAAAAFVSEDGTRHPVRFLTLEGAPAPIWYSRRPLAADLAVFVYRKRGHQLEEVSDAHLCGQSDTPARPAQSMPSGLVFDMSKHCLRVWKNGEEQGTDIRAVPGQKLRDSLGEERPVKWHHVGDRWYGVALPGTVRIELKVDNGETLRAQAVPDRLDQDVALFEGAVTGPMARKRAQNWDRTLTGYSADGKVLWTHRESADQSRR
ncbi:hypothetical protein [Nonomuraea longicatena]|uniref:Uncharacterized protein n=1 Tax=Nonomuraea longicatena TaxID=83682 RepID=A0ABP3Z1D5_9ACTN